eukprot:11687498-Alexandrium_andersonii.AAC.1
MPRQLGTRNIDRAARGNIRKQSVGEADPPQRCPQSRPDPQFGTGGTVIPVLANALVERCKLVVSLQLG